MNNAELREKVLDAAVKNHIWVNAVTLIRPTDETLCAIGRQVVQMLQTKENLLPSYHGDNGREPVSHLQQLTPVLYMSINAS